jgi:hypothetical protein
MQTINITAHTNDASQIDALKAVMRAMKIDFKISKPKVEKPYNSEFVKMVLDAENEIKNGKGLKVTSQGFDDLWK